jgi:RNA polymerase sigma-70 factor (ECF subfamily)
MQYTDSDILNALKRGERFGYEALVARYGQMVFTIIVRIIADEARAEELTQDTFIRVFETIGRYDAQRTSLSTWLCRIAYQLAIDELRRRRKDPLWYGEDLDESVGVDADYWIDAVNREAMLTQLEAAVSQLSVEEQNLLLMHYKEHITLHDIAFIIGEKDSTVRMRMKRISAALSNSLTKTRTCTVSTATKRASEYNIPPRR